MKEEYGIAQITLFFLVGVALTLSVLSYVQVTSSATAFEDMVKNCPMMSGKAGDMSKMHGNDGAADDAQGDGMMAKMAAMMNNGTIDHNAMHEKMQSMKDAAGDTGMMNK